MNAVALPGPVVYVRLREEPGALPSPVPFRIPSLCSCSINPVLRREGLVPHDGSDAAWARMGARVDALSAALGVDGLGSTICELCAESWAIDHLVDALPV